MRVPEDLQVWPGCWVGFDFDGTLATSEEWDRETNTLPLGEPIPAMVDLARVIIAEGIEVRIMTARVGQRHDYNAHGVCDDSQFADAQRFALAEWSMKHLGVVVPITATKDMNMTRLYDDRAVQVVRDSGLIAG